MLFRIYLFISIFFKTILSYYYFRYHSMIYSITLEYNSISSDFTSLFPLELSFSTSVSNDYYILGRAKKSYGTNLYATKYTYMQGDIALLEDNTYVVFIKSIFFERKSIFIGHINGFESILNNINDQNEETDTNKFMFETENECIPYVLGINGEKQIKLKLDHYYETINFSTRGTKSLDKVPPIYLNNTYLGGDCSIEKDGYSVKCIIKDTKWYKVKKKKKNEELFVKYRVNELNGGCYGPIYTGIDIYVSGSINHISLFISLILLILLLF